jgi:hypothetical protein
MIDVFEELPINARFNFTGITIGVHQQYGYARSVCVFACIGRLGKQTDDEDENVSKTSDAFVTLKRAFGIRLCARE